MGRVLDVVRERLGDRVLDGRETLGEESASVAPEHWVEVCRFLRDDAATRLEMLVDLTAVDYLGETPRFEVVAIFKSLSLRHRFRLRTRIDGPEPSLETLSSLWKNADWLEREAFDMYGIRFEGHPDLRRILMYPEFDGYPLRKDYPVMKRQPIIPERDPVENPWPERRRFEDAK